MMNTKKYIIAGVLMCVAVVKANAQLMPLGAMYFQNQYQNNPALAGLSKGLELNAGFRQQWSAMPGAPVLQTLTGTYAMTDKAGLGLNLYAEQNGLFKRTRVMGTYAYHLPLNAKNDKLSFGISLGGLDELIDHSLLDGDFNDPSTVNFTERRQYIDGDFGMAYTSNKLSLQAAMPNLRNNLGFNKNNKQDVDYAQYYLSASYKLPRLLDGEFGLEPKVAYRGIKGADGIIDFGANVSFAEDKVAIMLMYHSTQNVSVGLDVNAIKAFRFIALYTANSSSMANYSAGSFELGLKANLFK